MGCSALRHSSTELQPERPSLARGCCRRRCAGRSAHHDGTGTEADRCGRAAIGTTSSSLPSPSRCSGRECHHPHAGARQRGRGMAPPRFGREPRHFLRPLRCACAVNLRQPRQPASAAGMKPQENGFRPAPSRIRLAPCGPERGPGECGRPAGNPLPAGAGGRPRDRLPASIFPSRLIHPSAPPGRPRDRSRPGSPCMWPPEAEPETGCGRHAAPAPDMHRTAAGTATTRSPAAPGCHTRRRIIAEPFPRRKGTPRGALPFRSPFDR